MNTPEESRLKIRFRLPNGEEFEAEGSQQFIESQRNYFLTLIGKNAEPLLTSRSTVVSAGTPQSSHNELHLWEHLLKEDGETLILRHKSKLPDTQLALLLVAGARVLLNKEAYSALELAKSLKASGITGGRLDRMLAAELQAGRLIAQGSKRGRTYQLSDEGFARAFVLAEKLSNTPHK